MIYICCRSCLEDERVRGTGESMRSFERLSVSMNTAKTKLTIWCNRHQITVATIGIEGRFDIIDQGEAGG